MIRALDQALRKSSGIERLAQSVDDGGETQNEKSSTDIAEKGKDSDGSSTTDMRSDEEIFRAESLYDLGNALLERLALPHDHSDKKED